MNLVKWFRKNNKKAMTVIVIFICVGFVAQTYISQLSQRRASGRHEIMAYYADNRKITNYDMTLARQELEILKLLQADNILRNLIVMTPRMQDLHAALLAELLFSERNSSPAFTMHIKQLIGSARYRISEKQINDIYKRPMPNEIYWLLLKNEAKLAGIKASNEISGMQLAKAIPQFFNGATYSQLIGAMINQQGFSEEEILTAFSNLTEVLMYARMICSSEDVTSSQIMYNASMEEETVNVEFVKFDSTVFAETGSEPDEKELVGHFDKYKNFFAGDITDQNPYGFGYKLDDSVQLEYIVIKLDDVAATVTAPSQEEVEEFYQKHREELTASVPSDPNDPNSPPTQRIKSYGEVADAISKGLLQNKINSKADNILKEAETLTEAKLLAADIETSKISAEQFRQLAGDYAAAAKQLSEKYKIKVYTGQTGMFNGTDILSDNYLGSLFLKGYGYNPVVLTRIVFAIDELAKSELGPFDTTKPRLYENIGPASDTLGRIMAVVRITKAQKASAPESINQIIGFPSLNLGEKQPDEKTHSIRELVAKDLKKLEVMDTTKNKADEFIALAEKDGWENAVNKFNKLYKQSENDANAFKLQNLTNLQRTSSMIMEAIVLQNTGNPAGRLFVNQAEKESQLINQLYSLVPQDSNTIDTLPLVTEFKPDMSYYCIKNITVKRLDQEQYDKIKSIYDYQEDFIQSQSLAPVHLNPENIVKRMNFRLVRDDKGPADINTPPEPQGDF
ncbi:MAG: hypothetical protein PHY02_02875 [Phycisphaerae bacterium]|nr:hypothetical protein [Phycisphaerae bacterium]